MSISAFRPGVALALTLILGACAPAAPSPAPAIKQPPPAATVAAAPTTAPAATSKPAEAATPAAQAKPADAANRARTDLVIAMTQKSVTLDPTIDSAQQSDVKLLYDPLVFLTPDMKIQPALATEWRLVDPTTWELKLRRDVKFHNGDPFTAADVKFNFDRILNPDTQSRQVNWDEIIDKVLNGYAFRNATSTGALTMGYDPSLKPYPYDPEKARQLLAEAGYPNGFDTSLDGTIDRYNADREVGEAIVGQLA